MNVMDAAANEIIAQIEAKLSAAGKDRLVEWDSFSEYDRTIRYGLHPLCGTPYAGVRILTRDDAGAVHLALDRMCPACDVWLSTDDNPATT